MIVKKLAPHITRQRFLIEGHFNLDVSESDIKEYLQSVSRELALRTYAEPIIYSPEGMGKGDNQGFDAFIPLIDSGISLYAWTKERFLSVVFYTCKHFSEHSALKFTKEYFVMGDEIATKSF